MRILRHLVVWTAWFALVAVSASRWLVARLDGSGTRGFAFGVSIEGNAYIVLPILLLALIAGPMLTNRYLDRRARPISR